MTTATSKIEAGAERRATRRLRVRGRAELRGAMRAARTVMSLKAIGTRNGPTCRLVARDGAAKLEVLATNGEVAVRTYIDTWPQNTSGRLDVAIERSLVRRLAETKADSMAIEQTPTGLALTADNEPAEEHGSAALGIDTATLDRIFQTEPTGITVIGVSRQRALLALRAMPRQTEPVCRLRIGSDGIHAWATNTGLVGPQYEPEGTLTTLGSDGGGPIVCGINRKALTAVVAALRGRRLDVTIESEDKPIRLHTAREWQTAVIATKRLS